MFERCLYFNVNALARVINRIWDETFAEFDLSPSHAYLLRLVVASPGMTAKQVCVELKLEKSTVSRFLNSLEQRGFIQRKQASGGDAREQGIYASPKTRKIARQLEARGDRLYKNMMARLGKDELQQLVGMLRQSEAALK